MLIDRRPCGLISFQMKQSHYLVAIDPSLDKQPHFEWIRDKFLHAGDTISILTVLPESHEIDSAGDEQMVRMQIQTLLGTIDTQVEKKSFVTFGSPFEEILKKAQELQVTAIVMCSSGKNTLTTFFVGSVCEQVLKNSKIAVMICK